MSTRKLRVGIFGRGTSPTDGGADTLLAMIERSVPSQVDQASIELVPVPWAAWSHRRRPLRYLWCRIVRGFGGELPLVDLRPVCRRFSLDLAYFAAPAFAHIDIPFVFTLWDIGHRTIPDFPEMRSGRDPWTHREALCRRMLAQASFVITGNSAGAAEAVGFYGLDPQKVVPLPFPNPDFAEVAEAIPAGMPAGPFLLYPAQGWPHKNHHTLLQALAVLKHRGQGVPRLVLVGSDKGNWAHVRGTARTLGVADRVHVLGFVSRAELMGLYRRALALVFPSLLGPNNLPPQEAAVLGCPMILSDLPGHREQLGDGALYADPMDAPAWADAIGVLAASDEARIALAARARQAVSGYTQEAYAARLGQLLEQLARRRLLWD